MLKKRLQKAVLPLLFFQLSFVANVFATGPLSSGYLLNPAQLILINGKIYTDRDHSSEWSDSMSIRDGSILTIGKRLDVLKEKGQDTQIIDLKSKTVIAGFNDAQINLFKISESGSEVSSSTVKASIVNAEGELLKNGIATIQTEHVTSDQVAVLAELVRDKKIKFRITLWGTLEKAEEFAALREKYKDISEEWFLFYGVKATLDGNILDYTASLSQPYSDKPSEKGRALYTQENLNKLVLVANKLGLPVSLKATGDHAVGMAINAFESVRHQLFNSRLRNRLESVEVVPAKHVYGWIANRHITVSIQPNDLANDSDGPHSSYLKKLGKQRLKDAFNYRSFINANVKLSIATSWPEKLLNPFVGISTLVFLKNPELKNQNLSIKEAIDAYTIGGAYSTHEDHLKGSLREGKVADVIVLSDNPFTAGAKKTGFIETTMTIVNGQIVYGTP